MTFGRFLCGLLAGFALACGSTTSTSTTRTPPPPPEPAEPPSALVRDDAPPPIEAPSTPGVDAPGALVYQSAHRRGISDLAFTPDGRHVVAASADGVVSVVDVPAGKLRASRRIFVRTAHRRVFPERSGRGVYVGSGASFRAQGGLLRWDLGSDTWTWLLGPSMVFDPDLVALAPDDRTLAFLNDENTFAVRAPDGTVRASEITRSGEHHLAFAPSGVSWFVFAGESREIWILDPVTAETRHHLGGEDAQRWLIPAYRPGGGALAVASEEGAILLLHPGTGEVRLRWSRAGTSSLREVGWAAGGEQVFVVGEDHHVEVFDAHTGAAVRAFDAPELERSRRVDPASSTIWTAERTTVRAVDLASGATRDPIDVGSYVGSIAVSQDGSRVGVGSGSSIVVRDAQSGDALVNLEGEAGEHSVWGVTWSPDSRHLATWGRAGVEIWGTDGARSTGCTGTGQVVFSSHGNYYDQRGSICDLATGNNRPNDGGRFVAVDHESGVAVLAVGEQGTLRVFDTRRGRRGATLRVPDAVPCYDSQCHKIHVSGQRIAVISDGETRVFDARGRRLARIAGDDEANPWMVRLAPGGDVVVIVGASPSGGSPTVSLHRVRGGRRIARHALPNVASGESLTGLQMRFDEAGARAAVSHAGGVSVYTLPSGDNPVNVEIANPFVMSFAAQALVVNGREGVVVVEADGTERLRRDLPPQHAISVSGEQIAFCEEAAAGAPASLVVHDALTSRVRRLGPCFPTDGLDFSPDQRFLAQRSGPIVQVHRLDASGGVLTLRTYRHYEAGQGMVGVPAASDASGRFQVDPAHLGRFLVRAPGPLRESQLAPAAADAMTADLVASFFTPPPD